MTKFSTRGNLERVGAVMLPFLALAKEVIKVMFQFNSDMKKGIQAGNDLVREILALKVVSLYKMAKDLGVNRQTVYNWKYGHCSPEEHNYMRIKDYRLYVSKLQMIGVFH